MNVRQMGLAVAGLLVVTIAFGCAGGHQTTFATPDDAARALADAIRSRDDAALRGLFGAKADELLESGDAVADRQRKDRFLKAYDERHVLEPGEDRVTLVVGNNDWPLPIPIVKSGNTGAWRFDTEAGLEELLNRRIGQNELDVIEVCQAIVDAQSEYARRDPNGDGVQEYARKFISEPGQRNGLYWETKPGEELSPLGPMLADAAEEGYSVSGAATGEPRPYHGYYFRMLESQGPSAPGGAVDYLHQGKLIGGFGVVAYPAQYGNSGIMTFLISHAGELYQKDLGEETAAVARAMKSFDPGEGWQKVATPGPATQPQLTSAP